MCSAAMSPIKYVPDDVQAKGKPWEKSELKIISVKTISLVISVKMGCIKGMAQRNMPPRASPQKPNK